MATTNIRYVDPDADAGGDGTVQTLTGGTCAYVSLNAWEAARQANLVDGDIIERAVCSSNLDAGSGTADTTLCDISGWTTDSTRYIQIDANSSHGGKWNDNYYRITGTNADLVTISEDYVKIDGIQAWLTKSNTTYVDFCFGLGYNAIGASHDIRLSKCIMRCTTSGDVNWNWGFLGWDQSASRTSIYLINCLIYDFLCPGYTAGGAVLSNTNCTITTYNVTVVNCYNGFDLAGTGVLNATNCGASGCTAPFDGSVSQTTCSSSTPTFEDPDNDDYHLSSADTTWAGNGTDLSGTFTDDIDGETRSNWDIGCDEYVSAGTDYPWPPDATGYGTNEEVIPYAEFASSRNRVGAAVGAFVAAAVIAFSPIPSTGVAGTFSAGADCGKATYIVADVSGYFSTGADVYTDYSPDIGGTEVVATGADFEVGRAQDGQIAGFFEVSEQGTYSASLESPTAYTWPPDATGYGINGVVSVGADLGYGSSPDTGVAEVVTTGADLGKGFFIDGQVVGTFEVSEQGTYSATFGGPQAYTWPPDDTGYGVHFFLSTSGILVTETPIPFRLRNVFRASTNQVDVAVPGYSGTPYDKMRAYYTSLGYTGTIRDMEFQFLADQGYTSGSLKDRWIRYYATTAKELEDSIRSVAGNQ